MTTDAQLCELLDRLAAEVRKPNGLLVSDWENDFIGSYLGLPNGAFHFTEKRRRAIEKMWRQHGAEINWPHPQDRVSERPKIPAADPGGCEYLEKDDDDRGRQHRCNLPATCREPGRLRYCESHGAAVKRACPKIALVDFLTTDGHG